MQANHPQLARIRHFQGSEVAALPARTAASANTLTAIRFLDNLFSRTPLRKVSICLWDGTLWPDQGARAVTIVLKHSGALRRMFSAGTEKALAEAYLNDDFDIQGDVEAAFEIADALSCRRTWRQSVALALLLRGLPDKPRQAPLSYSAPDRSSQQHSLERDQRAIAFHYDVSNDFYRSWLDRRMVYSCAYFQSADNDLETAQTAKLDYICRKLRLKDGQKVLDVGCGWGGFALYAAEHFGVNVTGVSLSQEQVRWANELVSASQRGEQIKILCKDYRALSESSSFDAIVSIGMSEHVGREKLPGYFGSIWRLLKPGGVFLNHAIGEGCRYRPSRGPSFIDEYVFPDSDIPPIESVLGFATGVGFEVRDVENLREHYALTLRHWVRRLESRHSIALSAVSEATYRVWRLYMAGSAYGFDHGRLAIYQALFAKPDENGRSHLPLTRQGWYSPRA
jgi:cyclopropane-fatty-acyl-phospholipid synthase